MALGHQDLSPEHPASADPSTCKLRGVPWEPWLAGDLPALVKDEDTHSGAMTWLQVRCFLRTTLRLMWVLVWFSSARARTVHPGAGTE